MRQIILQGWTLMRGVRLLLGLVILIQGLWMRDVIYGGLGAWLSVMALINVGCCGTAGCRVPAAHSDTKIKNTDIEYEEVDQA